MVVLLVGLLCLVTVLLIMLIIIVLCCEFIAGLVQLCGYALFWLFVVVVVYLIYLVCWFWCFVSLALASGLLLYCLYWHCAGVANLLRF